MLLRCHFVTLSQGVGYVTGVTRVVTSLVTMEFRYYFYQGAKNMKYFCYLCTLNRYYEIYIATYCAPE